VLRIPNGEQPPLDRSLELAGVDWLGQVGADAAGDRPLDEALARQAEAERERRAKIINAEGEFQASERLKDAALVIEDHPVALQLRYLQTLLELGGSQSTTIVFPAPIDLITPFVDKLAQPRKITPSVEPEHRQAA
jgi:regulator of protease activity HflC (stomatin/prohibitin superfamily)